MYQQFRTNYFELCQFFFQGVFECGKNGLTLTEIAEGVTLEQVRSSTGCEVKVVDNLKPMQQA